MARERWLADDWEITQGLVRDVERRDGLYRAAGKRGGNVTIAGQHGDLWRPKKNGPASFVLNVWLGTNSRAEWEVEWDNLLRALTPGHRLVRYRRLLSGGEWREAYGEVLSAVEPAPNGNLLARGSIEVNVPSGRWRGLTTTSQSLTGTGRLSLTAFAGSTAPLDDLTYRITGPITNPRVLDVTDVARGSVGNSLTWTGVIGTGQTLVVDAGAWAVTGEGGLAVPDVGPLSFTGDRFLTLPVAPPGESPAVQLDGSNVGVGAGLAVGGYLSYLA